MDFTREPIIETIITPKEGYKLILRNSKGGGQDEYTADAIEVVSFGHSFFFRSLERPKSFLVPVSDYEVIETKETRVVLKNANLDRAIKIGGGREAAAKAIKEASKSVEVEQEAAVVEQRLEKKRERRRHRRRRGGAGEEAEGLEEPRKAEEVKAEGGEKNDEMKVSSSIITRLIPPPQGLISDKIFKEKKAAPQEAQGDVLPELEEDKPKRVQKRKRAASSRSTESEDLQEAQTEEKSQSSAEEITPEAGEDFSSSSDSEGSENMQRVAVEDGEIATSTAFSTLEKKGRTSFFGKIW